MTTSLSGKERGKLKSLAKTRPVDLKVGKKGITENLLAEIRRILEDDSLLSSSFPLKNQSDSNRSPKSRLTAREPHSQ